MTVETNCQVDVELIHWERWKKTELHKFTTKKKIVLKYMPYMQTNESCRTMIFWEKMQWSIIKMLVICVKCNNVLPLKPHQYLSWIMKKKNQYLPIYIFRYWRRN